MFEAYPSKVATYKSKTVTKTKEEYIVSSAVTCYIQPVSGSLQSDILPVYDTTIFVKFNQLSGYKPLYGDILISDNITYCIEQIQVYDFGIAIPSFYKLLCSSTLI